MDDSRNNPTNSSNRDDLGGSAEFEKLDRVHELTWALFDEQIDDAEFAELESLLLREGSARESYIRCVQMHADLTSHYAETAAPQAPAATKTPILGFLNEGLPQFGAPTAEDAVQ